MRREFAAALLVTVLLLAGCQGLASQDATRTNETTANETTPDEVIELGVENGTLSSNATNDTTTGSSSALDDPETDRLGWEGGYWHNESIPLNSTDGLNESEQAALVNRSMARVEYIRQLEFDESVPVEVISREEYRSNGGSTYGDSLRTFDNAKFEALFLVGEEEGSISTQDSTLGSSVLGYYSPREDAIVIVSDSETPTIAEGTLGHELVHALQDQRFTLNTTASTRDGVQGRNGLVEGDASAVDNIYNERCGEEWDCLTPSASGGSGGGGGGHVGISFLYYFPYSDGAVFVSDLRERGGWSAVNDAYADPPDGAREVITPEDYPDWEPETVRLPDTTTSEWERVRPSTDRPRPDYATVGPSAIAATMAYTRADSYNPSSVVSGREIVNYEGGQIDSDDPYNYDLPATSGWEGGRMYVYTNGTDTGYVWRTVWTDGDDASEFAEAWADVIEHWGGTETSEGTWVIEENSPFADAVEIHVDNNSVTVVNAPTESQLSDLYDA
jgi:hypothetical protein